MLPSGHTPESDAAAGVAHITTPSAARRPQSKSVRMTSPTDRHSIQKNRARSSVSIAIARGRTRPGPRSVGGALVCSGFCRLAKRRERAELLQGEPARRAARERTQPQRAEANAHET